MAVSQLIAQLARARGLDPKAVLSVASQEGLSGRVGDHGTSFGPFQLHIGGAMPRGIANPQQWAMSRPGLVYALNQIQKIAGGLQGRAAVESIVRRFERPQNPGKEILGALAAYGSPSTMVSGSGAGMAASSDVPGRTTPTPLPGGSTGASVSRSQALLQAIMQGGGIPEQVAALNSVGGGGVSPAPSSRPVVAASPNSTGHFGGITELFYDPLGGYKYGKQIGAIGGHSDHVHVALTNAKRMLAAISLAQKLGLHVSDNPYVDPVEQVHAPHSYHYRNQPGLYSGKHLGEAFDASGTPAQMATLYRRLAPLR